MCARYPKAGTHVIGSGHNPPPVSAKFSPEVALTMPFIRQPRHRNVATGGGCCTLQ